MSRKILVLDTSVLLYDMTAIHSFPGNDIVIPLTVLDELDRFKDKPGLLGESARYVNRYLDKLRANGGLDTAVEIPDSDQTIRVEIELDGEAPIPPGLSARYADNKILATALFLARGHAEEVVKVITKDINLRVKCDALGLIAEDYYRDHIDVDKSNIYTGQAEIHLAEKDIDLFYKKSKISKERIIVDEELHENQFVVGKGPANGSILGIVNGDIVKQLTNGEFAKTAGIEPRNKEQRFALHMLQDPAIQLVSITGLAGSGKTFLTLMAAMAHLSKENYKQIIFTRSIQPVGRDLGYLPGDMQDKMSPWLAPIMDNFRHAFGDMTYFEIMREKGKIDIAPLSYIRGRTFNDAFVIVDEAQNTTIHELKTIITRVGKGSKIVLLGDIDQVDTPYIDTSSNGLTIVAEKFKSTPFAGHIQLTRGQRSDIATLAANIL
ncbi:MAG: phosphate starvation-inducible protein PhoH [Halobacteriovorax sp.]|nr:phosphate starvation-inducible protein PhoH [Halobacteriovorax sp.]|tara:strand:+ start:1675 stop:2982 length:1308 start_codon:yes stop_codon:yes gene_type:complete